MEYFFPNTKKVNRGGTGTGTALTPNTNIFGARAERAIGAGRVARSARAAAPTAPTAPTAPAAALPAAAVAPAPVGAAPRYIVNNAEPRTNSAAAQQTTKSNAKRLMSETNIKLKELRKDVRDQYMRAIVNARSRGNASAEANLQERAKEFLTKTAPWRSRKSRRVTRRNTRKYRN